MALIHDIRSQPRHVRKLMFGLSVITTVSLVGMIWLNSFQNNMYALLNPTEDPDQSQVAKSPEVQSPLASLKDAFKSAGASLMNLFSGGETQELRPAPSFEGKARAFPLSE